MSFTARWSIRDVDGGPDKGAIRTVTTDAEVDDLVGLLSDDVAETARIHHADRPLVPAPFTGKPGADHVLTAAVHAGYGYLGYLDPDHDFGHPVGDPASPVYHSDSEEFDAGSGIPVETLTSALKEFLATAQRPTCVDWTPASP
ncbi:hypothetical protein GCM10022243_07480 [Saccharothrix violaceirubra]|uniref:Immunity protein Imm1 n=1 Tax=Saccharothrix violaceirubra TaxID=413306 RepID=A0A7W7SYQ5_9PSEU|nr:Imm1 family immunity protein [Saccharothrix violaceirubra]MBB4963161.1 hypothetical protein [Saccharothrix violaceirubra]